MSSSRTVVLLRQPDRLDEAPLMAILRSGARQLLAQAVEAEAEAFLAAMKSERLPDGRDRGAATTRERGVIGHGQRKPEQAQHAGRERFSLTQGEAEHEAQRQHQLDRQIRVDRLPIWDGPPRGRLPGQRRRVQLERDVASPPQPRLVSRPVLDAVAGPRDAMTVGGVVLERHQSGVAKPLMPRHPAASMHQRHVVLDLAQPLFIKTDHCI